jgi:LytS/YehU family sensor histidine kinase
VENDRDEEAPSRRRNGVGLKNVRSRLEARYGKGSRVSNEALEDKFRVSLSFPEIAELPQRRNKVSELKSCERWL